MVRVGLPVIYPMPYPHTETIFCALRTIKQNGSSFLSSIVFSQCQQCRFLSDTALFVTRSATAFFHCSFLAARWYTFYSREGRAHKMNHRSNHKSHLTLVGIPLLKLPKPIPRGGKKIAMSDFTVLYDGYYSILK